MLVLEIVLIRHHASFVTRLYPKSEVKSIDISMNFKTWVEDQEMSLGGMSPELMINRGSDTPASDEVKRTNMQPQVDAKEPELAKDADRVSAIDAGLEHLDTVLPQQSEAGSKTSQFKKIWSRFKQKWDQIKQGKADQEQEDIGLGASTGDPRYLQAMQQHPNMVPSSGSQIHGPGTFGQE
jgi:hypothetical protein